MNRAARLNGRTGNFLGIDVLTILSDILVDGIIAKRANAARAIRALAAMANVLDVVVTVDVLRMGSVFADDSGRVGNDNRTITRIARHIEVEDLDVAVAILSVIGIGDCIRHIIVQLDGIAITDLYHHAIGIEHLKVSHLVPDVNACHSGVRIANGEGVVNGVVYRIRAFGNLDDRWRRRLFLEVDLRRNSAFGVLTLLLSNVSQGLRVIDAVVLCGLRVDDLSLIGNRYRAITRSTLGELVVEDGNHVGAIAIVSRLALWIDLDGLTIEGNCDLALRYLQIRHIVGNLKTGELRLFVAVGNVVGNLLARYPLSAAISDGLGNGDGLLGLFDCDLCLAAGHVLCAIDAPRDNIGLKSRLRAHCLELLFCDSCVVCHPVCTLGNTFRTKSVCNIKGEVLTALLHAHGSTVDLYARSVKCLKTAQCVIEDHRVKRVIYIDICGVVQSVITVSVRTRLAYGLVSVLHLLLIVNGDRVARTGELIGPLVLVPKLCSVSLGGQREESRKGRPAIKVRGIRELKLYLTVDHLVGTKLARTNGDGSVLDVLNREW